MDEETTTTTTTTTMIAETPPASSSSSSSSSPLVVDSRFDIRRSSHHDFLGARNWDAVTSFIRHLLTCSPEETKQLFSAGASTTTTTTTVPVEVPWYDDVANLQAIHNVGLAEFKSSDPRFKRQTFAMRVGYDGSVFNGYQRQLGASNVVTVEEEIFQRLGQHSSVSAGRTDKDVSAISQVISFSTYDNVTAAQILEQFNRPNKDKDNTDIKVVAFECVRVPRRFHALFQAVGRRYLFLFPLNIGNYDGVDVNIPFVDAALGELVGKELSYDAFAYREDRSIDGSDKCTLVKARAYRMSLATSSNHQVQQQQQPQGENENAYVPTNECMCVELAGDRFLRRMVRILVATVVRASITQPSSPTSSSSSSSTSVLVDICLGGRRQDASVAVNGVGLCMAGAGYDLIDLGMNQHQARSARDKNKIKASNNNNNNNNSNNSNKKESIGSARVKRKAVQHGVFEEEESGDEDINIEDENEQQQQQQQHEHDD